MVTVFVDTVAHSDGIATGEVAPFQVAVFVISGQGLRGVDRPDGPLDGDAIALFGEPDAEQTAAAVDHTGHLLGLRPHPMRASQIVSSVFQKRP